MPTPLIHEVPGALSPFPRAGISRDEPGVRRYDQLPASLLEMLKAQVANNPDTETVVELGGPRLTYRQLWEQAARVAGGLQQVGLKRGDRVAIPYPAGANWVLAFWGTIMAGGLAVAINTRSAAPEVEFVVKDSGARIDLFPEAALPDGAAYVADDLTPEDTAALFYTSGTTGSPEGVPTSHEAFLTNAETMVRCLGLPRDIEAGCGR
jgi:acyl-CoA synthetase (AMP-forming)/AMP-acid ligase II